MLCDGIEEAAVSREGLAEVEGEFADALRSLFVVGADSGGAAEGVAEDGSERVAEVFGAFFYTVEELGLDKLCNGGTVDEREPPVGDVDDFFAQFELDLLLPDGLFGESVGVGGGEEAGERLLQVGERAEIEELGECVANVGLLDLLELGGAAGGFLLLIGDKRAYGRVASEEDAIEWSGEDNALEGFASAEGHVDLAGCE